MHILGAFPDIRITLFSAFKGDVLLFLLFSSFQSVDSVIDVMLLNGRFMLTIETGFGNEHDFR
jgi:hypothetical protein